MPSRAMIRGAEIVEGIDRARSVPIETIRGRRMDDGSDGVSITIPCHNQHGYTGEYYQTIVVPLDADHPMHPVARERLAQLLGRWLDIEARIRDYAAERDACDVDDDADTEVDDDMPVPAARVHAPLVLRAACDEIGMDDAARLELLDEAPHRHGRMTFRVDDVDIDDHRRISPISGPRVSVRRATITVPGFKWTQGANMHYVDIDQILPASILNAMVGMPVRHLIGMPGLSTAPGVVILKHGNWKGRTRLDLSRAHGYLGGRGPDVGHDLMDDGRRT